MLQRLAIVSHSLPPAPSGQARMIERLLMGQRTLPSVLICTDRKSPGPPEGAGESWFRCHTPWVLRKTRRFRRLQVPIYRVDVRCRAKNIARISRATGCSAIIACTGGDLIDLPAAITAGRQAGLPVFLHYFDDYRFQWRIPNPAWHPAIAAAMGDEVEAEVLAQATGVVAPNEILAADIGARARVPIAVVRNPIDTESAAELRQVIAADPTSGGVERIILYTGSVYEAQGDSLRRCAAAVDALRHHGHALRLHIYTSEPMERIREQRLPDHVRIHPAVDSGAAVRLQAQADILFLPLAFGTRYPELIRSSAPGKFGEYLASGRPTLVHAPGDSFPAVYVSRHECGAVCDQPDTDALAATILRLLADDGWTQGLIQRAVAASDEFSITTNRHAYQAFIESRMP